jgi:hypothetical protein
MELRDAALRYAAAGYAVLPLWSTVDGVCTCRNGVTCPKPGKHPTVPRGVLDATCDTEWIDQQWTRFPRNNIGLVVPAQHLVFDIDVRKGGRLEALDVFPETVMQRSGSGGWHVWFTLPKWVRVGDESRPVEVDEKREWLERAGIDLRLGGKHYVVVEPSVHATGGRYVWDPAQSLLDREPATLTGPLLDAILREERESLPDDDDAYADTPGNPDHWYGRMLSKVQGGASRDKTLFWGACQMHSDGIPQDTAERVAIRFAEHTTDLRDHSYSEEEALRCVRSAYRYPPMERARRGW